MYCALVLPIQGLPRNQNVTQGALWVGEVTLLQDHHCVPGVLVPEVHSRRRLRQHLDNIDGNYLEIALFSL